MVCPSGDSGTNHHDELTQITTEYSHLYRDDPLSTEFSALKMGPFFLELKQHILDRLAGGPIRYWHNSAHDGSIAAVLGFLQVDEMVWPGVHALYQVWRNDGLIFTLDLQVWDHSKLNYLTSRLNIIANVHIYRIRIAFEVYADKQKEHHIRILWKGQVMVSSSSLGRMDVIPLEMFFTVSRVCVCQTYFSADARSVYWIRVVLGCIYTLRPGWAM